MGYTLAGAAVVGSPVMRVSVLGAGAWGTALARVLADGGADTVLWSWQPEHADAMATIRENQEFFPGFALPASLQVTSDVARVAAHAELLVLVVPSHALRRTLLAFRPFLAKDVSVVSASKGIEVESLALMTEVITQVLADDATNRVAVLSGPSFAREVAERVPTNLVAASLNDGLAHRVQDLFSREWLRVYTSRDPIGVELGGAMKNVIAIASGASDGLGLGQNTRAALITRGIAEMSRLATAMGGQSRTLAGLSGMGDLVLTCTGDLSRNRVLGFKLGQGAPLAEAMAASSGVAEGYWTAKSVHDLGVKMGIDLPICGAVYAVLHQGSSPLEELRALLSRPLHGEWE